MAKGRITVVLPFAAANAFVRRVRWAGTFASGGRRSIRNALMHMHLTMGRYMSPQSIPSREAFIWISIQYMMPLAHTSRTPNGISIGSAVCAGLMTYSHLWADGLYTGISSGPNARYRVRCTGNNLREKIHAQDEELSSR